MVRDPVFFAIDPDREVKGAAVLAARFL